MNLILKNSQESRTLSLKLVRSLDLFGIFSSMKTNSLNNKKILIIRPEDLRTKKTGIIVI
jgi:hypothetical protein